MHSSLDLVAAVITYLSVRVADKPADAQHLYGHGKVESFSAFVETALLLLTAVYIIWEAFERLFFHGARMRPSVTAIVILMLAMGIDFVRSRALGRVAKKYPSEALEADALHFSTDVWSTFVVILGITGAWVGAKFNIPWLTSLDAVAALGVAGVIIWVGSRLGLQTMNALLDVAPSGLRERISSAVNQTEGVLQAERVRVRRAGAAIFCGRDDERAAHGQSRTGARGKRRRGAADRADRAGGRGGTRGAAGADRRTSYRDSTRDRAAARACRSRAFSAAV